MLTRVRTYGRQNTGDALAPRVTEIRRIIHMQERYQEWCGAARYIARVHFIIRDRPVVMPLQTTGRYTFRAGICATAVHWRNNGARLPR